MEAAVSDGKISINKCRLDEGNLHFHLYNTTVVIIIDKMLKFTDKNLRRNRMFELPQSTPFQDVYQYKENDKKNTHPVICSGSNQSHHHRVIIKGHIDTVWSLI